MPVCVGASHDVGSPFRARTAGHLDGFNVADFRSQQSRRSTRMHPPASLARQVAIILVCAAVPAMATAQAGSGSPPAPATHVSMEDAVRLALVHNHQLQAQRLSTDLSKADEITAALKPNPVLTSTNASFPVFSPSQLTLNNIANNQSFVESLGYLFERGGKREKRIQVAQDTTIVAARNALDSERQLTFQTKQSFIAVLLAKSALNLAQDDLKSFATVVDVNRERFRTGDLAEADFMKIELQRLQFEQDVSAAELALAQARSDLRQNVGFEGLSADFDVDGELAFTRHTVALDTLLRDAEDTRPDLMAARGSVKLAEDTVALATSNRARDVTGEVEYDRAGPLNGLGVGLSIELPFHDRNQGNIAQSKVAVRQATELEAQARTVVRTDVANALNAFHNSEQVLGLFESGYLSRARQSLDIATYVYQGGNGTLLDLLDAERTYRTTELAYRQALAAYMTSVEQINLAVGRQVIP
jgi:cobalt-zinc-cadmium efflux system outer membrane protein